MYKSFKNSKHEESFTGTLTVGGSVKLTSIKDDGKAPRLKS